MASISPYTIAVPDDRLKRLSQQLSLADFPDELDQAGWDYGAPLADIKRLVAYWKDTYDWRRHEATLNELPNFHTDIQADGFEVLDIHFVWQKSDVEAAIPLLFVHGCIFSPSVCFVEVKLLITRKGPVALLRSPRFCLL